MRVLIRLGILWMDSCDSPGWLPSAISVVSDSGMVWLVPSTASHGAAPASMLWEAAAALICNYVRTQHLARHFRREIVHAAIHLEHCK